MSWIPSGAPSTEHRLESWKEIASYLRRTVRTVQRWEREQGLPVHRLRHNKLPTIYAFARELDDWWEQRRSVLELAEALNPPVVAAGAAAAATDGGRINGEATAAVDAVQIEPIPEAAGAPAARSRSHLSMVFVAAVSMAIGILLAAVFLDDSAASAHGERQASALVLRGRQFWNQRTPAGFREALKAFQQSIAFDPSNGLAYSGLADTYSLMHSFGLLPADIALPAARAAAQRAIDLAPEKAAPHASVSMVLWESGQHATALAEAERAIALDSTYATARHWRALYLNAIGRPSEAIDEARTAQTLDPLSPIIICDVAVILRGAGRVDEARRLLESLATAHPAFPQIHTELSLVYSELGRDDLALSSVKRAIEYGDDRPAILARVATFEALNGNVTAAGVIARRIQSLARSGALVPPEYLAQALVAANLLDEAFALAEQAVRTHEPWAAALQEGSHFMRLRQDPRWPALAAQLPTHRAS